MSVFGACPTRICSARRLPPCHSPVRGFTGFFLCVLALLLVGALIGTWRVECCRGCQLTWLFPGASGSRVWGVSRAAGIIVGSCAAVLVLVGLAVRAAPLQKHSSGCVGFLLTARSGQTKPNHALLDVARCNDRFKADVGGWAGG